MPNAIELIVSAYVGLKDKAALDDLRMQRRKLAVDLKARTGFDCRATIQQIEEDIIWRNWMARRRPNHPRTFRADARLSAPW